MKKSNDKKVESYQVLWTYPLYHKGELFTLELVKLLNWEIKPNIRSYKAYEKNLKFKK